MQSRPRPGARRVRPAHEERAGDADQASLEATEQRQESDSQFASTPSACAEDSRCPPGACRHPPGGSKARARGVVGQGISLGAMRAAKTGRPLGGRRQVVGEASRFHAGIATQLGPQARRAARGTRRPRQWRTRARGRSAPGRPRAEAGRRVAGRDRPGPKYQPASTTWTASAMTLPAAPVPALRAMSCSGFPHRCRPASPAGRTRARAASRPGAGRTGRPPA